MMGDSHHFILLRADFSDASNIKGVLVFKGVYRAILSVDLDPRDKKQLNVLFRKGQFEHYSENR